MSPESAPEKVFRFIDRHIESVEQLEILLLLANDDRQWFFAEIFRKIQSSENSVRQRLEQLVAAGLVVNDGGPYRFEPSEKSARETVRELGELYREKRVRVIEAIYSRKTDAVQAFADAFKLKKPE